MSTRAEITVTLPADVNQVDDTGFVWAFLGNAGEPERVQPGAIIVGRRFRGAVPGPGDRHRRWPGRRFDRASRRARRTRPNHRGTSSRRSSDRVAVQRGPHRTSSHVEESFSVVPHSSTASASTRREMRGRRPASVTTSTLWPSSSRRSVRSPPRSSSPRSSSRSTPSRVRCSPWPRLVRRTRRLELVSHCERVRSR